MKTILSNYFYALIILFHFSCQEEFIPYIKPDQGKEYYPVAVGKYITYQYDSVVYDDEGLTKYNLSGYIKEEIKELIEENTEFKKYKLIKYWRKHDSLNWLITDVESVTVYKDRVIKTEENLPFIKMIFPNDIETKWNGNAMFDQSIIVSVYGEPIKPYEFWEYKVINKENPYTIKDKSFDETLEVLHIDDNLPRSLRYSKEIFAKNIGLIKKEMKIYDTQNPQTGQPWEAYAQKGYSLIQEIVDYN